MFVADFSKPSGNTRQNQALSAKYGVTHIPTVFIVTAEGKVIKKTGYIAGGAANYVKHLKTIIK